MSRPPLLYQEGSGTPNSVTPSLTRLRTLLGHPSFERRGMWLQPHVNSSWARKRTHDHRSERLDARCLASKQVRWEPAVAQHRVADVVTGVVVESGAGEVLEAEVLVGVDLRAGDPRQEIFADPR